MPRFSDPQIPGRPDKSSTATIGDKKDNKSAVVVADSESRAQKRSPPRSRASRLAPDHGGRTMKVYPVSGPEMASLKAHSINSSIAFTFAGALLGYAIDIYINASFSTNLTGDALFATHQLAPCLIVVAILFGIIGGKALLDKRNLWSEIEKSTTHQDIGGSEE